MIIRPYGEHPKGPYAPTSEIGCVLNETQLVRENGFTLAVSGERFETKHGDQARCVVVGST